MHVCVVGAGVIGAAVAEELARRGRQVVVLDMRGPGRGASQASAGVLSPYIEATPGSELLRMGTRSLALWPDFVARVSAQGGSFEYSRTGTLEVALSDEDAVRLRGHASWLQDEGVAHEWIEGSALTTHEPAVTPAARGGLRIDVHGFVNVSALVRSLMQSARLHGAVLEAPQEVVAVEPAGNTVDVRIGQQRRTFDRVVIAAGSWSSRVKVVGHTTPSVRPIRGQLLHLEWKRGTLPTRSTWGPRCYTVPWADGSLLVGATVEDVGFDESTTVEGVRGLLDSVTELLPDAASAAIKDVRVGLRPVAADKMPVIGPLPDAPHVHMATAHYRNGILLAPLTAQLIADQL